MSTSKTRSNQESSKTQSTPARPRLRSETAALPRAAASGASATKEHARAPAGQAGPLEAISVRQGSHEALTAALRAK
jgi:hypothetical protein